MANFDASKQTLYTIQQDLSDIFEEIEENGGEVNDEILSKLEIKKEELAAKCNSYISAIKYLEQDIDACKKEKQRVDNIKKRDENRIKFMKDSLKFAVKNFGEQTKTGGYKLKSELNSLSLSRSTAMVINEDLLEYINALFAEFIADYFKTINSIDEYIKDVDNIVYKFLDYINNAIKESVDEGEEPIEITERDLEMINIKTEYTDSMVGLIHSPSAISLIAMGKMSLQNNTKSSDVSEAVKNGEKLSFVERSGEFNIRIN